MQIAQCGRIPIKGHRHLPFVTIEVSHDMLLINSSQLFSCIPFILCKHCCCLCVVAIIVIICFAGRHESLFYASLVHSCSCMHTRKGEVNYTSSGHFSVLLTIKYIAVLLIIFYNLVSMFGHSISAF